MKKTLLASAVLMALTIPAFAETCATPDACPGKGAPSSQMRANMEKMFAERFGKALDSAGATAEQKTQALAAVKKSMEEHRANAEKLRAQFEAQRKANDEQLTNILGKEKFAKFQEALKSERMRGPRDGRRGHFPPPPMNADAPPPEPR